MWRLSGQSIIISGDETLTLLRPNNVFGDGVQVVDGIRQKLAPPAQFTIRGNVQPVTGDDLLLVPEGDRFNEQLFLWVQDPDVQPEPNDYVIREGQTYLVMSAESWGTPLGASGGVGYTRSRIQRVDVGPDRYQGPG